MELSRDLLFFFSALGAFNSFLLSIYFLVNLKRFPAAYFFLGLLLLFFSLRAGVSCLYYFGDIPRTLIKLGLAAHLLLGPTLFYFAVFRRANSKAPWKLSLTHIGSLALLLGLLAAFFDFYQWDYNIRYSIHTLLTLYFVGTGVYLLPEFKMLFSRNQSLSTEAKDILFVYLAVIAICLGFVVSLYTTYILGPLVFSLIFYTLLSYRLFANKKTTPRKGYQHKLDTRTVAGITDKLRTIMAEQKPYKDPDFSLDRLATLLSVSRHFLSQMLNDNLQVRYTDLVNQYRIEEACQMIRSNSHYNLEAIAYEVGFNSKSTFYATFKKVKGTTPSKYRATQKV